MVRIDSNTKLKPGSLCMDFHRTLGLSILEILKVRGHLYDYRWVMLNNDYSAAERHSEGQTSVEGVSGWYVMDPT